MDPACRPSVAIGSTILYKVVTHRYPVDQAGAAIQLAMTNDCMKVVIASPEYL